MAEKSAATELISRRNRGSILETVKSPFEFRNPWTPYECFKLFFNGVTLLPLRIVVLVVTFIIGWLYIILITCGSGTRMYDHGLVYHSEPFTPCRQAFVWPMYFIMRIWHWCMGFWSIKVNDLRQSHKKMSGRCSGEVLATKEMTVEQAKVESKAMKGCKGFCFEGADTGGKLTIQFKSSWDVEEAAGWTAYRVNPKPGIVTCAPHVSIADPFMMGAAFPPFPSAVGDMEITRKAGCLTIGVLARANQTIFVDRFVAESREKCKSELARRADTERWTGIETVIFPEGTTTNGEYLIKFKDGAFAPGQPVQPVAVKYPNKYLPVKFTGDGKGPCLVIRLMTQFANFCEVDILEPYVPSQAEKDNSHLYAENVRKVIANHLGIGVTEHTIADATLHNFGLQQKIGNQYANDFVVADACEKYGVESKQIREWLKEFGKFDQDRNGYISTSEFKQVLSKFASQGLPGMSILPKLNAYVKDNQNSQAMENIFTLFDTDRSDKLTFREFVQALGLLSDKGSTKLEGRRKLCFLLLNANSAGKIAKAKLQEAAGSSLPQDVLSQTSDEIDFPTFSKMVDGHPGLLGTIAGVPPDV